MSSQGPNKPGNSSTPQNNTPDQGSDKPGYAEGSPDSSRQYGEMSGQNRWPAGSARKKVQRDGAGESAARGPGVPPEVEPEDRPEEDDPSRSRQPESGRASTPKRRDNE